MKNFFLDYDGARVLRHVCRHLFRDLNDVARCAAGIGRPEETRQRVESYGAYESRNSRGAVGRRRQGQDRRHADATFLDRRPLSGRAQRRAYGLRQRTQVRAPALAQEGSQFYPLRFTTRQGI